jgi:hypothetical protein
MITEADIQKPKFMERAVDVKPAPIDSKVYEESQKGIMRLIFRTRRKLKKANTQMLRLELTDMISRLKVIENDLQRALEI